MPDKTETPWSDWSDANSKAIEAAEGASEGAPSEQGAHEARCSVAAGSAFRPCPGHYTRENWLAYRVIAQLSESGLDINTSPAVQVWDVVHREIIAWMQEHGIKTGLRPQERDSSPNNADEPRP